LKILPSNQSLILAGEPGGPRVRSASGGAALQRLTILTARQDSTVVVQADYFSPDEASQFDSRLPVQSGSAFSTPALDAPAFDAPALDAPAAEGTNFPTPSRAAKMSSYLNPIELYTRTQRGLKDSSKPALLDVLA
jgi:hypothetical protein